ncbi:WD repeat-containing protein 25 [Telopea speciosissima]|uniref:WD repeat-containing protein 25 n=1 Tax=Telopea speciosissima TaxID=54955 RepID=UPI001CC64AFD|nr:WD repeat-containing protein 25 [Telopea speciosissima]
MDVLRNTYSTASDDEYDDEKVVLPPSKRFRPENPTVQIHLSPEFHPYCPSKLPKEASVPGRYVSKRERALSAVSRVSDPSPSSMVITSPVVGSISESDVPCGILSSLRRQAKGHAQLGQIPQRLSKVLRSHTNAVNSIQWSPTHSHLLASAGMDDTVCVWNVWSRSQQKARVFKYHNAAVKDVKWSEQGLSLLSSGYDCSSRLVDVEKGIETQLFKEDQIVGVIKFHPDNGSLFLSGGSKGLIRLWDTRVGKVVQEYIRGLGPILDIEFSLDAKHFISSSDVSRGNVSENSIIVWDVQRQIPLSNQVYVEAFTCPCVRYHPFDPLFVAQSNGNYIAIFSSKPPFKLDKYRRYESHGVSGFPIKCNFSLDGERLASGSSDGCIYFYNYRSSKLLCKLKAYDQACVDVAFHPIIPNVVASCCWNGDVSVFE